MGCDPLQPFGCFPFGPHDAWQPEVFPAKPNGAIGVGSMRDHYALADPPAGPPAPLPVKELALPPPEHPVARILYDLATQLENFSMDINLSLPLKGLNDDDVTTKTQIKIGEQGALILLGIEMNPAINVSLVDGIPVIEYLDDIPLLGIFFRIAVLEINMDPETRRLKACLRYVVVPFPYDVHDRMIKLMDKNGYLSKEVTRGSGIDQKLPLYTWQMLDVALRAKEQRTAAAKPQDLPEPNGKSPERKLEPLWDRSTIEVTGNFSNQRLKLMGYELVFDELRPFQKHRLTLKGPLLNPLVAVHGFKELTIDNARNRVSLENQDENPNTLYFRAAWDPTGKRPPLIELPNFHSRKIKVGALFKDKERTLEFSLDQGVDIQNLAFAVEEDGAYVIHIDSVATSGLILNGMGVSLQTQSTSAAVMEDLNLVVRDGVPYFSSKIRGQAEGVARYFMEDEERGRISFNLTREARGRVEVGPDATGRTRIIIDGDLEAVMPELRLLVRSEEFHGYALTAIEGAKVTGHGKLTIFPEQSKVLIESATKDQAVMVRGTRGHAEFGQDLIEVPDWTAELERLFGSRAREVTTAINLDIDRIEFGVHNFELFSYYNDKSRKSSFLIRDAVMGPIHISGSLNQGRVFLRGPSGTYLPIDLVQQLHAPPTEGGVARARVSLKLDLLTDQTSGPVRTVDMSKIDVLIEDEAATLSPREQELCGTKGVHIHASLDRMMFLPKARAYEMKGVDHVHVVLKNPFGKGCLLIK